MEDTHTRETQVGTHSWDTRRVHTHREGEGTHKRDMRVHRGTRDTRNMRVHRGISIQETQGTQGVLGIRNTHILSHDILDKRIIVYYNNNIRILFLVVLSRPLTLGRTTRGRITVRGDV